MDGDERSRGRDLMVGVTYISIEANAPLEAIVRLGGRSVEEGSVCFAGLQNRLSPLTMKTSPNLSVFDHCRVEVREWTCRFLFDG